MSWDPYIASLTSAGIHHALISSHNGQPWASSSASFTPVSSEIQALSRILSHDADALKRARKRGFTLQSLPYTLTRIDWGDDDTPFLLGRCKEPGAPAQGVLVARTAKTVIVAVHDPIYAEGASFGGAYVALFRLAESLTAMSF